VLFWDVGSDPESARSSDNTIGVVHRDTAVPPMPAFPVDLAPTITVSDQA